MDSEGILDPALLRLQDRNSEKRRVRADEQCNGFADSWRGGSA